MIRYFEGWYYKHQNGTETVALIPGFASGKAFIQVITDERSYYFEYELSECRNDELVQIGGSIFFASGVRLAINQGGDSITGSIVYNGLTPLKSDIMGFFRHFPMQCSHGVLSLHHRLSGSITINGRVIDFTDGTGYIEKDSGRSFPKSYAWVHSNDFPEKCSVMAAIAHIPFAGLHFRGIICAIWFEGVEYRLATYLGAKAVALTEKHIAIRQGKYRLDVAVDDSRGHLLRAPETGTMSRMIKESPSCSARFVFEHGSNRIFDMVSAKTSFEFSQ